MWSDSCVRRFPEEIRGSRSLRTHLGHKTQRVHYVKRSVTFRNPKRIFEASTGYTMRHGELSFSEYKHDLIIITEVDDDFDCESYVWQVLIVFD